MHDPNSPAAIPLPEEAEPTPIIPDTTTGEDVNPSYPELVEPPHPAEYDTLTGLPGERLFQEALESAVTTESGRFGVLFFDLDGLKAANDSSADGHSGGDALLRTAADGLQVQFRQKESEEDNRKPDVVARLHGDEFAVIIHGISNSLLVHLIATRAQEDLQKHGIETSVGAALHNGKESGQEVLKRADTLMYENKQLRKLGNFDLKQLGVISEIDELARNYGIDLRDAIGAIDALRKQTER